MGQPGVSGEVMCVDVYLSDLAILTAEQQRSGCLDAVGKHPDELLIDLSGALAADLR